MRAITQPLRDEHQQFLHDILAIRDIADSIGDEPLDSLLLKVDQSLDFLIKDLLPHFSAEDRVLYPMVAKIMDSPQATNTMRMDHAEMRTLVDELTRQRAIIKDVDSLQHEAKNLYRILYSLYTLVILHFSKEEEIYLSIIDDHLTSEEGHCMLESMGMAVKRARPELVIYAEQLGYISIGA